MSLVQDLAPVGEHRGFTLERGRIEGRPVLLATLEPGWDGATVLDVVQTADRLGSSSISVADSAAGPAVPRSGANTTRPHVLLGEVSEPAASVLATSGILVPGLLPGSAGVDLAALALSYLPARVGGETPVFAPVDRSEVDLGPSSARNAVATAYAVCDDLLRVHHEAGDELVLGLGRVCGRAVAVVAPQPVVSPDLDVGAFRALVEFLGLAARFRLPVAVLGGVQSSPEPLLPLARALADLAAPVLLVGDDAPPSTVQQLFWAAPTAVPLPSETVRANIARWID